MIHALTFAAYAVSLNGRIVLPHARAAVAGGRVLLPVRALGNALGADVGYDGRAHTITVQRGAHVATIPSQGAVRIVKGSAYAPLRAVASAFGLSVGYDAPTRTVALADPNVTANELGIVRNTVVTAPQTFAPPARTVVTVTTTPQSGAQIHDPYPRISARFSGAASLDPRTLRVTVDGRDVGRDAAVIGDEVLLTPRTALAPGNHTAAISALDATGAAVSSTWSFVDDFAFAVGPPPAPYPINAIWIDRWIQPGTNAFDVYVQGAPGITGYIGVDGVGGYFPLRVYSANAYVAHVIVPPGVYQPFARVAARITLPNGTLQTIVLPQTIDIATRQNPFSTQGYPSPVPSAHPRLRIPLGGATPSPPPTPRMTPSPTPTPRITPPPKPTPTARPTPSPTPRALRTMVPPIVVPTASPSVPADERTAPPRKRVPPVKPHIEPTPSPTPTPVPKTP